MTKKLKDLINESVLDEDGSLHQYLLSRGLNPNFVSKQTKISHAKSGNFLKWKQNHQNEEVQSLEEDSALNKFLLARGINPATCPTNIKVSYAKSSAFLAWKRNHTLEAFELTSDELLEGRMKDIVTDREEDARLNKQTTLQKFRADSKARAKKHDDIEKNSGGMTSAIDRLEKHLNKEEVDQTDLEKKASKYDFTKTSSGKEVPKQKKPFRGSLFGNMCKSCNGRGITSYQEPCNKCMGTGNVVQKEDVNGKERYHTLYPHVPLNMHKDHEYNKLSDKDLDNTYEHQGELADKLNTPGASKRSEIARHIQINREREKYDQQQAHKRARLDADKAKRQSKIKEDVELDEAKNYPFSYRATYHDPDTKEITHMMDFKHKSLESAKKHAEGNRLQRKDGKEDVLHSVIQKEEVEPITEISKKTLASYRDKSKASLDIAKTNRDASEHGKDFSRGFAQLHAKSDAIVKKRIKGLKGYLQRVNGVKPTSEEVEQIDEISTKTLAHAAHAASDPEADYSYNKDHDPQKFVKHAAKTKDDKSVAAVRGAANGKGHFPRHGLIKDYDKLTYRTPARVTASGKANKQDINTLKGRIQRNEEVEQIDELKKSTVKSLYDIRKGMRDQPSKKSKEVKRKNVASSIDRLMGFKPTSGNTQNGMKEEAPIKTYGKQPKIEDPDTEVLDQKAPTARTVVSGGTTLTGEKRDTIEIDPLLKNKKPGPPDTFDTSGKKGSQ